MKIRDTSEAKVTNIYFVPMKRSEGNPNFIGFVSLRYSGINFKGISVHETSESERVWLDYPRDLKFDRVFAGPADKETHDLFEKAVSAYLKEHWDGKNVLNQKLRKRDYDAKSKEVSTESTGSIGMQGETGS